MNLTKVYTSLDMERFRAVNNVSVGIRQGEIFGLCGSNGSGKTELFKLLTLDSHPSEGTIFIDNRKLVYSRTFKSLLTELWYNLLTFNDLHTSKWNYSKIESFEMSFLCINIVK